MSQNQPDELQHLARAILILLLPFEHAFALPAEIRKRAACREYWEPLGGVNGLCEELRRLFAAKYSIVNYEFPKELDALLVQLAKLPSRAATIGNGEESYSDMCKLMRCPSVGETLKKLGESRYNQDHQTI